MTTILVSISFRGSLSVGRILFIRAGCVCKKRSVLHGFWWHGMRGVKRRHFLVSWLHAQQQPTHHWDLPSSPAMCASSHNLARCTTRLLLSFASFSFSSSSSSFSSSFSESGFLRPVSQSTSQSESESEADFRSIFLTRVR